MDNNELFDQVAEEFQKANNIRLTPEQLSAFKMGCSAIEKKYEAENRPIVCIEDVSFRDIDSDSFIKTCTFFGEEYKVEVRTNCITLIPDFPQNDYEYQVSAKGSRNMVDEFFKQLKKRF